MLDTWLRPEEGILVNRDEGGGSPSGMIMMIDRNDHNIY